MKIYITGCAKTGTTLVRRLFNAFGLNVCVDEINLNKFVSSKYDVGKRTGDSILSNVITDTKTKQQIKTIIENDVKIINVVRNKLDVLKSENGYVASWRYDSCVRQSNRCKDIITYTVDYDELIINPNKIQEELSELLNLPIIHKFSDYPKFIDHSKEKFTNNNYKLREIGKGY